MRSEPNVRDKVVIDKAVRDKAEKRVLRMLALALWMAASAAQARRPAQ